MATTQGEVHIPHQWEREVTDRPQTTFQTPLPLSFPRELKAPLDTEHTTRYGSVVCAGAVIESLIAQVKVHPMTSYFLFSHSIWQGPGNYLVTVLDHQLGASECELLCTSCYARGT